MKHKTITIETTTRPAQVDAYVLPSMYTSGLCIIGLPNKGGGTSYGITHVHSGLSVVAACTEHFGLIASALRKLWKRLSKEEQQLFKLKDSSEILNHPLFEDLQTECQNTQMEVRQKAAKIRKAEIHGVLREYYRKHPPVFVKTHRGSPTLESCTPITVDISHLQGDK